MRPRIAASAARSAAVTGSKPALPPLFSTLSDVLKNGRIALPETSASSSTNAAKSTAVMRTPLWGYGRNTHGVNCRFTPCVLCGAVAHYCSAVTRLRRVTAALLGRFLPRLGPLATASGPFFLIASAARDQGLNYLFGGRLVRTHLFQRNLRHPVR